MHPLRPICAALTLLLATACGSGSDAAHGGAGGGGGTGGALAGTIDGQPWTLSAAYTDSFLTNSTDAWVILRGEPDPGSCASPNSPVQAPKLQVRVPRKVGEYPISADTNREVNVLIPPSTSLSIGTGTLVVKEASATIVKATLTIDEAPVQISGELWAEICD